MSDAYIIEIADETAGIVVRQQQDWGYRFHAAVPRYFPLEGKIFAGPRDAERAANAHFIGKRKAGTGARS
jgi:hypothetical protein